MKWKNKGHQFDELGKIFEQRNSIYIYGAGIGGKDFFEKIEWLNIIDSFIDQDKEKQKNGFMGYKVYSPEKLFNEKDDRHIIIVAICSEADNQRIMERLMNSGYIKGVNCFFADEFLGELGVRSYYLPIYSLYAKNKVVVPSFCCIPSTLCNLNCKHCLNFTPMLTKFENRDLKEVCRDIDLLFKWVDYTFRFQISGGEPLLYKNFNQLVEYIGENYRERIDVFETILNGTIVPDADACRCMKKYNMKIYLDNYTKSIPENLNKRKEIIEKLNSYEIEWIDNSVEVWFNLDIENTDNSSMSNDELISYFDTCNNPWNCYEKGKIYACNFARFAEKANINREDKNDYFDLNTLTSEKRKDLIEFILNYNEKGFVDFCKNCAGWASINTKFVPVAVQSNKRSLFNDN